MDSAPPDASDAVAAETASLQKHVVQLSERLDDALRELVTLTRAKEEAHKDLQSSKLANEELQKELQSANFVNEDLRQEVEVYKVNAKLVDDTLHDGLTAKDQRISDCESELAAQRREIDSLRLSLELASREKAAAEADNRTLQALKASVDSNLSDARADLQRTADRLAAMTADRDALAASLRKEAAAHSAFISTAAEKARAAEVLFAGERRSLHARVDAEQRRVEDAEALVAAERREAQAVRDACDVALRESAASQADTNARAAEVTTKLEETVRAYAALLGQRDDAVADVKVKAAMVDELTKSVGLLVAEVAELERQLEEAEQDQMAEGWQRDKDVPNCGSCRVKFTLTKRRHHCRVCGGIFCAQCTTHRVKLAAFKKPQRTCDGCQIVASSGRTKSRLSSTTTR